MDEKGKQIDEKGKPMDEKGKLATVTAIIERDDSDRPDILVQTRWKKKPHFNGTIEVPGGHIKHDEYVYDALRREVKEETGLDIVEVVNRSDTLCKGREMSLAFNPFCCLTFLGSSRIGFAFVCRAKGEISSDGEDGRDARWIPFDRFKSLVERKPDKFFPYVLSALKLYIHEKESGRI